MNMLNGDQQRRLRDAIADHYLPDDFIAFLEYSLDKKWHLLVTSSKAFPMQLTELISKANYGRWYFDLIRALLKDRPDAKGFAMLAYEIKLLNVVYDNDPGSAIAVSGLEALVNADVLFDVNALVSGILDSKRCICRIEIQGGEYPLFGTGFLVGADWLLTNYHVVEPLMKDDAGLLSAWCRFDYEVLPNGSISVNGTMIPFKRSSVIAYSKYSMADIEGSLSIDDAGWPDDQLDYALIRLDTEVGNEQVSYLLSSENHKSESRGWIKARKASNEPYSKNVIILQHPEARPMKVAIGLNRSQGLSPNKSRIRYNVNTMKGSSGSPCFDEKFNWVAMHNMGDPNWNPAFNQGITSAAIIRDLEDKGIEL